MTIGLSRQCKTQLSEENTVGPVEARSADTSSKQENQSIVVEIVHSMPLVCFAQSVIMVVDMLERSMM